MSLETIEMKSELNGRGDGEHIVVVSPLFLPQFQVCVLRSYKILEGPNVCVCVRARTVLIGFMQEVRRKNMTMMIFGQKQFMLVAPFDIMRNTKGKKICGQDIKVIFGHFLLQKSIRFLLNLVLGHSFSWAHVLKYTVYILIIYGTPCRHKTGCHEVIRLLEAQNPGTGGMAHHRGPHKKTPGSIRRQRGERSLYHGFLGK